MRLSLTPPQLVSKLKVPWQRAILGHQLSVYVSDIHGSGLAILWVFFVRLHPPWYFVVCFSERQCFSV